MTRGVRYGHARQFLFDAGIGAAGHQENIRPAIVIQIDDAGAPADIAGFDAEAGAQRGVSKLPLPSLTIEVVRVFGEVGFEEIEVAIEIEVADADAHAGLHLAVRR